MVETKYRSPIVDKAAMLLDAVAAAPEGASLGELAVTLGMPRSTVYRILNSLAAHRLVSRINGGSNYELGQHFVELAGSVTPDADRVRLLDVARPIMLAAASAIHESLRLSVPEGNEMLTIDAVQSPGDFALLIRIGARSPLHVGASGKIVLACSSPEEIDAYCARPLEVRTQHTIVDPDVLREVLAEARAAGFAEDHMESGPGIRALAAPIFSPAGVPAAALSSIYFGEAPPQRHRKIRGAVVEAAKAINLAWNGYPSGTA